MTHLQVRPLARFSHLMAKMTLIHAQVCLFGFRWYCSPFRGSDCPKTQIWGHEWAIFSHTCQILKRSYYQNYCINHHQILQSDRPQILWVTIKKSKNLNIFATDWITVTVTMPIQMTVCNPNAKQSPSEPVYKYLYKYLKSLALVVPEIS